MNISKDLMGASIAPLILSIVSKGDQYGYSLLRKIREFSGGRLEWHEGTLYPVLHRLERQKLIDSRVVVLKNGVGRKYYRLTRKGRAALDDLLRQWVLVYLTLGKINPKMPPAE